MTLQPTPLRYAFAVGVLTTLSPASGSAQSPHPVSGHAVSSDRAIEAARTVLGKQGYELVRIDHAPDSWTLYYRQRSEFTDSQPTQVAVLTITRIGDRMHFLAPPEILIDIEIELAWPPKRVADARNPRSHRPLAD